jgi:hypothetical protein
MTYGHAEMTLRAMESNDLRFLIRDIRAGGRDWISPDAAEEIAKDLLLRGWTRR